MEVSEGRRPPINSDIVQLLVFWGLGQLRYICRCFLGLSNIGASRGRCSEDSIWELFSAGYRTVGLATALKRSSRFILSISILSGSIFSWEA